MIRKALAMAQEVYLSSDVEADGPIPGPHSMLSFASVAFVRDTSGWREVGTFSANLATLPEASGHPDTMDWWGTQPDAWAACRSAPEPPEEVMPRYVAWLEGLPGRPVFCGYPVAYDFMFVYWYVVRFGLKPGARCPFGFSALDIKTLAMDRMSTGYGQATKRHMPRRWFAGTPPHTHLALDDARGQGILLMNILDEPAAR